MSDRRTIRIFCPIHEAGFDAPAGHKVLCEITGHSLSTDFPNGEVWEFCCNCATFSPSKLGQGEKARNHCFSCQNEIAKRFVCAHCKTLSFECGVKSKGQAYFVSDVGIAPACPACQFVLSDKVVKHDCDEIGAEIVTTHETCPYCLEGTSTGFVLPDAFRPPPLPGTCQNCYAANPATALFCGKCKFQIRSDLVPDRIGTDINKSQLLGSLCPTCSTVIPPDSDFCSECGQAVKRAVPPPPPPPPKKSPETNVGQVEADPPGAAIDVNNPIVKLVAAAVGGLIVVVIIAIAITSGGGGTTAVNNASQNANRTVANAMNAAANSANAAAARNAANHVANAYKPSNSGSRSERTGTLQWDTALREWATKDAPQAGIHYRYAKVRILEEAEVNEGGRTSKWYKVEVTQYGTSVLEENGGQEKDPYSQDVGWVNSYPEIYYGGDMRSKRRINMVKLDR